MNDDLARTAETLFAALADFTLQGAIILGAAWGFLRALRGAPAAVRHAIGLGALIAVTLLLPLRGVWPRVGVLDRAAEPERGPIHDAAAPAASFARGTPAGAPTGPGEVPAAIKGPGTGTHPISAPVPPVHHAAAPEAGVPTSGPTAVSWRLLALGTWTAGVATLGLRLLGGLLVLRRIRRRATPADAGLRSLAGDLAGRAGLRRMPPVLLARGIPGPMVGGILRPAILLPAELARSLTPALLGPVLLHEALHVARRDPWANALAQVVRALLWHVPFAWLVVRDVAREREILTDAAVVRRSGARADYAEGLLRVLESGAAAPRSFLPAVGVADLGVRQMRNRLEILLGGGSRAYATMAPRQRMLVLGAVFATAAAGLSAGVTGSGTAAAMTNQEAPASASGATIEVRLTEPLPAPESLRDLAVAKDWPEERRRRADRVLIDGEECEPAEIRERLRAKVRGRKGGGRAAPAEPRLEVHVARGRPWSDVVAVLQACGEPDVGIRQVQVVPEGVPAADAGDPLATDRTEACARAIAAASEWLVRRQDPDGFWECPVERHHVGVTGLAVLALLGTIEPGVPPESKVALVNGVDWLRRNQDAEGCIGPRADHRYSYDHAIALLALSEAAASGGQALKDVATRAVGFALRMKNPHQAWRYGIQPGDNDSSVSGWMMLALAAARRAGIEVPESATKQGLEVLDQLTDEQTGRTGYTKRGERPVRPEGLAEVFSPSESEALTALTLCVRFEHGQSRDAPVVRAGAELIEKRLPRWDPARGSIDMISWHFGTRALAAMGGPRFERWRRALQPVLLENQVQEGEERGSWDPVDPWGDSGGRVYSTALMSMALQTCRRGATGSAPAPK